jgi:hypothetical protein
MAKKQTRRSISVSRGTYERLKAYCETNQISMSQFVERRVGDYLGRSGTSSVQPAASVPSAPARQATPPPAAPVRTDAFEVSRTAPAETAHVANGHAADPARSERPATAPITTPAPTRMSSINQPLSQPVAAPNPVTKPSSDEPLLKDPDAKLTADQIFTF